jgi:hypothetical protein
VRREGEAILLFTNLIKLKLLLKKVVEMLLRKKILLIIIEVKGQGEAHLKARARARVSSRRRGNVVVYKPNENEVAAEKGCGDQDCQNRFFDTTQNIQYKLRL